MKRSERPMPHDLEAERAVLGALLTDHTLPDDVRLTPADFSRPDLGLVFEAIASLTAAGQPVDAVTVASRLEATGKLDAAGGKLGLLDLGDAAPYGHHLAGYARRVADLAQRRELIRAGLDVQNAAHDADTAEAALAAAGERLFALAQSSAPSGETLAAAVARRLDEYLEPLETVPVDGSNVRLHLGDLVVIGGRPATGKTAYALQLADDWRHRWPVLILSFEMSVDELTDRIITRTTGQPSALPLDGLTQHERDTYQAKCADLLADEHLELVGAAGMSEAETLAAIRRFAARGGRIAIIDYLQIACGHTALGENADLTRFTRSLQQTAKSTGVLVVGLSQFSREAAGVRPDLHHLRGSGSLEQEAAAVCLMSSPDPEEEPARKAELQLKGYIIDPHSLDTLVRVAWRKVRHGQPVTDYMAFDGARMRFRPIPRKEGHHA